jgi:hypothetical protein
MLFSKLEGAVTSGMIHLGDQLGLYKALAAAEQPLTTAQLAHATQLNERWVREWAYNQASAKMISTDNTPSPTPNITDDTFFLSPEQTVVLATDDHPAFGMGMFHRLPQTMESLKRMPESFRTGIGHNYDSHGPEGAVGIERSFEPWTNANLISAVLPALNNITNVLQQGAQVADVGCGAGGAVLLMAKAFPTSTFTGYEISQYALDRAAQKLQESKLSNAHFSRNDASHSRQPQTNRHMATRRHQSPRHVRPQRTKEPNGSAHVRHQRALMHVFCHVCTRRCWPRHARPLGNQRASNGRGCGLLSVQQT